MAKFTGRVLEPTGNLGPRGMMIENRIRLIPSLGFLFLQRDNGRHHIIDLERLRKNFVCTCLIGFLLGLS